MLPGVYAAIFMLAIDAILPPRHTTKRYYAMFRVTLLPYCYYVFRCLR